MGESHLDPLDERLLDGWQRDLPLVARPFAAMGEALGISEAEVLKRLARLSEQGAVSRVGATVRPNSIGASTLAAVAAPEWRLEEIAAVIDAEPGVNHNYLRENRWNIWFVATGPDRDAVEATLARIEMRTGLEVMNLPLERAYHIDLGFSLKGAVDTRRSAPPAVRTGELRDEDPLLVQALTEGLALTARPFAVLGVAFGLGETAVLARVRRLVELGVIARLGVIVRHRALGWRANAMVVWDVPPEVVDERGAILAAQRGINLCYRRRRHALHWPYNLYCMIHARSRVEAHETLARVEAAAGLGGLPRQVLFSLRCFKQKGALVAPARAVA